MPAIAASRRPRGRPRGSRSRTSRCGARCSGSAGLPARPGHVARGQRRTRPSGVWICAAMMPGVPWGATHSTLTSSSGASTVSPSHSLTRSGSPAISRQARENVAVGAVAGVQLGRDVPLDEERQLRVGDQAVDADLLPGQLGAVGAVAVAVGGLAPEPVLDDGDVIDGDDPAQPSAAECGTGPDRLSERRLVGRGMVQDLDDLEVGAVGQRQDHVAGAEARVHSAVGELLAQQAPEALGGAGQAVRSGGVGEMVQAHAGILDNRPTRARHRGPVLLTSRDLPRRPPRVSAGRPDGCASRRPRPQVRLAVPHQLVVRRACPSARSARARW